MERFSPLAELPFSPALVAQPIGRNTRKPLRIGAIFPFTGPIGKLGADSFDGANAALHLINDRGGVAGQPVEWVVGDGFSPAAAAKQAELMITQEGVRFVIGCTGSNHSIEVSKVCEAHGAIFWVQNSWATTLFDHKPRYTFRSNVHAGMTAKAGVDFFVSELTLKAERDQTRPRVGVVSEDGAYGVSVRNRRSEPLASAVSLLSSDGHMVLH
jgi:branched-chain amino acid transport system substrate-binding protein